MHAPRRALARRTSEDGGRGGSALADSGGTAAAAVWGANNSTAVRGPAGVAAACGFGGAAYGLAAAAAAARAIAKEEQRVQAPAASDRVAALAVARVVNCGATAPSGGRPSALQPSETPAGPLVSSRDAGVGLLRTMRPALGGSSLKETCRLDGGQQVVGNATSSAGFAVDKARAPEAPSFHAEPDGGIGVRARASAAASEGSHRRTIACGVQDGGAARAPATPGAVAVPATAVAVVDSTSAPERDAGHVAAARSSSAGVLSTPKSSPTEGSAAYARSAAVRKMAGEAEGRALFDRLFVSCQPIGAVVCVPCAVTIMDLDAAKSHFSRASHKAEEDGAKLDVDERTLVRASCRYTLRQRRSQAQVALLRRYTSDPWPASADSPRLAPLPGLPVYKERWVCATCHLVASNSEAEALRAHAKVRTTTTGDVAAHKPAASASGGLAAARGPAREVGRAALRVGEDAVALKLGDERESGHEGLADATGNHHLHCPGVLFVTDVQTLQRRGHSSLFPVSRLAPEQSAADYGLPPAAAGQMPLEQYASLRRRQGVAAGSRGGIDADASSRGHEHPAGDGSLPPLELPAATRDQAANRYEEVNLLLNDAQQLHVAKSTWRDKSECTSCNSPPKIGLVPMDMVIDALRCYFVCFVVACTLM